MSTTAVIQPYVAFIDRAMEKTHDKIRNSTLGHQEVLEDLWDAWQELRERNWDGYGAAPVDQDAYRATYALIDSLPLGFPRPSIGADPDGQFTLEWYKSPRRRLSISVDPDGLLHFAGLFGPSKRYGTLAFFATAPSDLIQLVREL
jgi:hypothetical protein